jgi:hypothetical protein
MCFRRADGRDSTQGFTASLDASHASGSYAFFALAVLAASPVPGRFGQYAAAATVHCAFFGLAFSRSRAVARQSPASTPGAKRSVSSSALGRTRLPSSLAVVGLCLRRRAPSAGSCPCTVPRSRQALRCTRRCPRRAGASPRRASGTPGLCQGGYSPRDYLTRWPCLRRSPRSSPGVSMRVGGLPFKRAGTAVLPYARSPFFAPRRASYRLSPV